MPAPSLPSSQLQCSAAIAFAGVMAAVPMGAVGHGDVKPQAVDTRATIAQALEAIKKSGRSVVAVCNDMAAFNVNGQGIDVALAQELGRGLRRQG